MTHELVKYVYGRGPKYTAFCLTPMGNGRKTKGGRMPIDNRRSRHFQTPEAAQAWLRSTGRKPSNPDWCPLKDTAVLGTVPQYEVTTQ
jgi:hypothetical protein